MRSRLERLQIFDATARPQTETRQIDSPSVLATIFKILFHFVLQIFSSVRKASVFLNYYYYYFYF